MESSDQNAGQLAVQQLALLNAVRGLRVNKVERILDKIGNNHVQIYVNFKDKDGQTLLMYAAQKGHIGLASLLIKENADVNAVDNDGHTALMDAAYNGHKDIVGQLIGERADVNAKDKDGKTALMWAAREGYNDVVGELIKEGANVNAVDNYGRTALIYAAANGHKDIVEKLIDKDAKVNLADGEDKTALAYAPNKEVAETLIMAGANARDENGDLDLRGITEDSVKKDLYKLHESVQEAAATKIQSVFRGKLARNFVKKLKSQQAAQAGDSLAHSR